MKKYDKDSSYGRLDGLIEVSALAPQRVTLIGIGSMGHIILNQLARHGVATKAPGRMRIIDGDIVTERNLVGTDYRIKHLMVPKVVAASDIIQEINPDVNITYWNHVVSESDMPRIVEFSMQSDLLGLFADDFSLMLKVSTACANICPQIIAAFGPNVDYAEIAFSIPGVTQPLAQTMGQRKRTRISKPGGLGTDTAFVANYVAGICLRLLLGDAKGHELMPCYANAPLIAMGLRKAWIFQDQPQDIARMIVYVIA